MLSIDIFTETAFTLENCHKSEFYCRKLKFKLKEKSVIRRSVNKSIIGLLYKNGGNNLDQLIYCNTNQG